MAWFPNEGMAVARNSFPLWLFGAVGSGGIARSTIPSLIDEYLETQKLKDVGPTLGGPTLGLSPLAGFPCDIAIADIAKIVNNPLTVEQIVEKYPVKDNFLAEGGYLTFEAFQRANADANPLAVKAVFDSFGKPLSIEPFLAQDRLNDYQTNGEASNYSQIKDNLLRKRVTVLSAVAALLFLLGLADVATATDFYRGWFPDWPGGLDFPRRLFTEEGSIFTIPKYFQLDVPEGYIFVPKD